jgi:hypothetical protein
LHLLATVFVLSALLGACTLNRDGDTRPVDEAIRKCFLDPNNSLVPVGLLPQLRGEISSRLKSCLLSAIGGGKLNPEELYNRLQKIGFACSNESRGGTQRSDHECELAHTERMYSIDYRTYNDTLWRVAASISDNGVLSLRISETVLPHGEAAGAEEFSTESISSKK